MPQVPCEDAPSAATLSRANTPPPSCGQRVVPHEKGGECLVNSSIAGPRYQVTPNGPRMADRRRSVASGTIFVCRASWTNPPETAQNLVSLARLALFARFGAGFRDPGDGPMPRPLALRTVGPSLSDRPIALSAAIPGFLADCRLRGLSAADRRRSAQPSSGTGTLSSPSPGGSARPSPDRGPTTSAGGPAQVLRRSWPKWLSAVRSKDSVAYGSLAPKAC